MISHLFERNFHSVSNNSSLMNKKHGLNVQTRTQIKHEFSFHKKLEISLFISSISITFITFQGTQISSEERQLESWERKHQKLFRRGQNFAIFLLIAKASVIDAALSAHMILELKLIGWLIKSQNHHTYSRKVKVQFSFSAAPIDRPHSGPI